jgi:phosphohistidine phosphatase
MKNLILIRHAKSCWNTPVNDRDRTLANRGIRDSHLVSAHFVDHLPKSFILYSSPAKRASETAIIFSQNISCPLECIVFIEELYTFDGNDLEDTIKSFDDKYENIILFGHNKAITDFVNKFGDVFIQNVPTSGLVFLTFKNENWKSITKGKTEKIIFPRDLKL